MEWLLVIKPNKEKDWYASNWRGLSRRFTFESWLNTGAYYINDLSGKGSCHIFQFTTQAQIVDASLNVKRAMAFENLSYKFCAPAHNISPESKWAEKRKWYIPKFSNDPKLCIFDADLLE